MVYPLRMRQKDLQTLFDHFTSLFNIVISFSSPTGDILITSRNKQYTFCQLVKNDLGMSVQCSNLHRTMRTEKILTDSTIYTECCHGLAKITICPVFNDKILRGYVTVGPFRQATACSAALLHKWFNSFQNKELDKAFQELPYMQSKYISHISCIIVTLTRIITSEGFEVWDEDEILLPVIRYMKEYPEIFLSLSDAAKILCKSYTRTSHLFIERYGKCFKDVRAEIKIEAAENLFINNPNISNNEIANLLGFEDSSYFYKYYRKARGCTFKEYRQSTLTSYCDNYYGKP